jgi:hypothetical protein
LLDRIHHAFEPLLGGALFFRKSRLAGERGEEHEEKKSDWKMSHPLHSNIVIHRISSHRGVGCRAGLA